MSWNIDYFYICFNQRSRPPREAVSWNTSGTLKRSAIYRRPPREVVSWNEKGVAEDERGYGSTSSWGRELKFLWARKCYRRRNVDLLVRSWVEIQLELLKQTIMVVDLLVRSWVEITDEWRRNKSIDSRPPREVVSWNDENGLWLRELYVDLLVRSWVEI